MHKKTIINTTKYPIKYRGNIVLLVLFLILWFPIALVLLFKNAYIPKKNKIIYVSYHGNYFWLFFWAIFFFPIAMILIFIVGFDQVEEEFDEFVENITVHRV